MNQKTKQNVGCLTFQVTQCPVWSKKRTRETKSPTRIRREDKKIFKKKPKKPNLPETKLNEIRVSVRVPFETSAVNRTERERERETRTVRIHKFDGGGGERM